MTDDDLDEIKKSFALVMKMLAEQRLDLEVCRVLLKTNGATDEEFQTARNALKARWDKQGDELIERIKSRRNAEEIRRLLESAEGTKQ